MQKNGFNKWHDLLNAILQKEWPGFFKGNRVFDPLAARKRRLILSRTLSGQLSFAVALLIVLAVLTTGGLVYFQAEKTIRSLVIGDLRRSAAILHEKVNLLLSTVDSRQLPGEIDYLLTKEAARLNQNGWQPRQWVLTEQGETVLAQPPQTGLDPNAFPQIKSKKTGVLATQRDGQRRTVIFEAIPEKGWYYVLEVLDDGYLASVYRVRMIALTVAVVVLVFSVWAILWLIRRMVRPLSAMQKVMEQVADGDLRVRMQETNVVQELAAVGARLNAMLQTIGALIRRLNSGIGAGTDASRSLLAAVEKNRQEFRETSVAMQEIGNGARQQASAVDVSAARMSEMSEQAAQLVAIMQETSSIAERMKRDIDRGMPVVEGSAQRMQQAAILSEETSDSVVRLVNGMQQIRGILATIRGIAEQTNLLSLNATIEAARAGEAGRGFTVVAQEVRKLADQSKRAAEEIDRFTESIEREAVRAIEATRTGKQEMEHSLAEAMQAKEAMQSVQQGIRETEEKVTGTVRLLEKWAEQVLELKDKLAAVRVISRNTLASAEQVQAISERQLIEAEQLQQSTLTLVNMMNQLDDETRKFAV
ncbi:methyl-accepting chemotaxis protein [Effusibacillus pohliae]|uniref:methyl-accepting chemotaxis protein n=1 Tax=Effusibacillus pohliae TaxID=232270 RepID=UPI00035EAADD|nr:methyl-accepting chemotaxis protein [Effusibacillus pohliae]